ncbi:RNA methyltransferase [Irregularibacter muris]|uniref:RNA methyltransferase n=1 Tax=Irregularibacter muris TaxID=1796619 RepID=A0AAE3HCF5_9FIRM|nr:RNA methyltransferase [Irregularibacter muris]MCR1897762.1 RNA methyltransferase [Irregularibacter muris]
MPVKITSNRNLQYKEWKKLHQRKHRDHKKMFLLEGIKLIREAIEWGETVEAVLFTEKLFEVNGGEDLYNQLLGKNILMYELNNSLMEELSQLQNSQGIMAIMQKRNYSLEEIVSKKSNSMIILEEIQDPGNLGTIIRTADAAGFDGIILSEGCVDIYNEKVLRATMGSVFHIPIIVDAKLGQVIPELIIQEYQVIGTHLKSKTFYHEISFTNKRALIIGNEGHGMSDAIASLCTDLVKIPIKGKAESLNAAIAAGILMYKVQGL